LKKESSNKVVSIQPLRCLGGLVGFGPPVHAPTKEFYITSKLALTTKFPALTFSSCQKHWSSGSFAGLKQNTTKTIN